MSGACALAYEVLYVRALSTLFGDMFYVHAALLSTFLVGIGVGAKMAHRFVGWLFLFEILTGIAALLLPAGLGWLSRQTVIVDITASPLLTIVATMSIVSIPSLLIGFCIPLLSVYIKAIDIKHLAFQGVYRSYNVGALMGLLWVEFVLVKWVGISTSLAVLGGVNIFNGLVLVAIGAGVGMIPKAESTLVSLHFPFRLIMALILVSIASAIFQMFFLKLTYLVFEPHRENFALGLAVTILGLALGAIWASKMKLRFELVLLCVPLVIGLIYVNYGPLLNWYLSTMPWKQGSEILVLVHKFVFGCLFALAPMVLFGATLPTLMREENNVAGESGHLLFIASVANAVGYLAYVLLGHPYLDANVLLSLIGCLSLIGAMLVIGRRWSKVQLIIGSSGIIIMIMNMVIWDEREFYLAQFMDRIENDSKVTIFKSGADSATLLTSSKYEWISYNGHPAIYVTNSGKVNFAEIISGVIPAISAPRHNKALVLGLGTGITGGTVAQLFDHTDVAEINRAFFDMLPELDHANMDIANNPTASLILADGRAYLVGKENEYDAIINSIPAPTYFSASKIYTVEFYRQVKKALTRDGVFSTWLAVSNMSEEGVQAILSALHKSFRYCDLRLLRHHYFMSTCSDQRLSYRTIKEFPMSDKLSRMLGDVLPLFELSEYMEDILLSDNIFENYQPDVQRENTDDDPVLEFMLVRNYALNTMGKEMFLEQQDLFNIESTRFDDGDSPDRFARRAGIYYLYNRNYFENNFIPVFKENNQYNDAWLAWKENNLHKGH